MTATVGAHPNVTARAPAVAVVAGRRMPRCAVRPATPRPASSPARAPAGGRSIDDGSGRGDLVDNAPLEGGGGVEAKAGQGQQRGAVTADATGQAHRPPGTRYEPEGQLG